MKVFKAWWDALDNKNLLKIWMGIGAFLVCFGFVAKINSSPFYGFAEATQQVVNLDYPVKIVRLYVSPGDKVRKGDRLLELDQEESKIRKIELEASLQELLAQKELGKKFGAMNSNVGTESPLDIQIDRTRQELAIIQKRLQGLYVYAEMDGIVGDINFKLGEQVSPFAPILTLYTETSTVVTAYVHESTSRIPTPGDVVVVASERQSQKSAHATVVSVGKRVIPFPARLLKYAEQNLWGREVLIRLPEKNPFDLGERVSVVESYKTSVFIEESVAKTLKKEFSKSLAFVKTEKNENYSSDLIFARDINKYIVAQEEIHGSAFPTIQFLNRSGRLEKQQFHLTMLPEKVQILSLSATEDAKLIRIEFIEGSNQKNSSELVLERDGTSFKLAEKRHWQATKKDEYAKIQKIAD